MWRLPWLRKRSERAGEPHGATRDPGWRAGPGLAPAFPWEGTIDTDGFPDHLTVARPFALVDGVEAAAQAVGRDLRSPAVPRFAPASPRLALVGPGDDVEPVPVAVRRTVERETGAALEGVTVRRGVRARAVTDQLGARAATVDGSVFVPDVAGSLTIGPGAALLAHELVHVAQQRRLGPTLAASAEVGHLEGQARSVEAFAAHPEARHAPDGIVRAAAAAVGTTRSQSAPGRVIAREPGRDSAVSEEHVGSRALRPDADVRPVSFGGAAAASAGALAHRAGVVTATNGAGWTAAPAATASAPPGVEAVTGSSPAAGVPLVNAPHPPAPRVSGTVQGASAAPAADVTHPQVELDELARRLYPSLRDQLKAELRFDRERAGRITDLQG